MRSIFIYLNSILLCFTVYSTQAQEIKKTADLPKPLFLNGITVNVDVASLVSSTLTKRETYSMEGGVQIDLMHKYYPIVEIGLAGANKITNDNIGYKTNGLFGKIGVDFNLKKQKKDAKPTNNLFLIGVRLGMTSFNYDINNIVITDNYWGGTEPLNYTNQPATKVWFEIVAGVRVEVYKNIFMGWTVRNKNLLSQDKTGSVFPWYIPGYGMNNSTNWGINYILGYRF